MPFYRNHTVLNLARGIKAFVSLRAGVTRGEVQDPEAASTQNYTLRRQLAERERRIERLKEQLGNRDRRIERLKEQEEKKDRRIARPDKPGKGNDDHPGRVL